MHMVIKIEFGKVKIKTVCSTLSFTLIIFVLLLSGCELDSDVSPHPEIISPDPDTIYYPDQVITIQWKVPDSTLTIEMQMLQTYDSLLARKGTHPFDTLSYTTPYNNTTSYQYTLSRYLEQKMYCGVRLRYFSPKGLSQWTKIRYYNIYPYTALTIHPVTIEAKFNFVTRRSSGVVKSVNEINIDSLIEAKGIFLTKLKFIKPAAGFISDQKCNIGDRFVIGFKEVSDGQYPFDVLADAHCGTSISPVTFYPFGGIYRNLYEDLGNKKVNMNLAYFYKNTQGNLVQHQLLVSLILDCYFE